MLNKPKKLFILSALLSKMDGFNRITSSMMGYRFAVTDAEARDSFKKKLARHKEGFTIDVLMCDEILRDDILNNLDW